MRNRILGADLKRRLPFLIPAILLSFAALPSCNRSSEEKASPTTAAPPAGNPFAAQNTAPASIAKGKQVYQTVCIACHNSDPTKPGSLGPDVFGSSKELLEARIAHAEYPPGYKPKRATHIMQPLPAIKDDVESIYLYLNSKQ